MMLTTIRLRLVLRPLLKLAVLICAVVVLIFSDFSVAHAENKERELSTLLQSVLQLNESEDRLRNLSPSVQTQMMDLLLLIQEGNNFFTGKTHAEQAVGVLTTIIEHEV